MLAFLELVVLSSSAASTCHPITRLCIHVSGFLIYGNAPLLATQSVVLKYCCVPSHPELNLQQSLFYLKSAKFGGLHLASAEVAWRTSRIIWILSRCSIWWLILVLVGALADASGQNIIMCFHNMVAGSQGQESYERTHGSCAKFYDLISKAMQPYFQHTLFLKQDTKVGPYLKGEKLHHLWYDRNVKEFEDMLWHNMKWTFRKEFLKEQYPMLQFMMRSMEKLPSFCKEKSGDSIYWVNMFSVSRYGSNYFTNFVHQVLIEPYELSSMSIPIFKRWRVSQRWLSKSSRVAQVEGENRNSDPYSLIFQNLGFSYILIFLSALEAGWAHEGQGGGTGAKCLSLSEPMEWNEIPLFIFYFRLI